MNEPLPEWKRAWNYYFRWDSILEVIFEVYAQNYPIVDVLGVSWFIYADFGVVGDFAAGMCAKTASEPEYSCEMSFFAVHILKVRAKVPLGVEFVSSTYTYTPEKTRRVF